MMIAASLLALGSAGLLLLGLGWSVASEACGGPDVRPAASYV